jgi:hypothetical protein
MSSTTSRRTILRHGVQALAALSLVPLAARQAQAAAACSTETSESLRESLNYQEPAPVAAQNCAACSFYTAAGNCGNCSILSDKVSPQGHCDSWAAKG